MAVTSDSRPAPERSRSSLLETLTLLHVGTLVIGAAWAFGGNTELSRLVLSCWGSLGVLLTIAAQSQRRSSDSLNASSFHGLWPLALLDALVLASLFNPSYRQLLDGAHTLYIQDNTLPHWPSLPSTTRPDQSLHALWFFNAAYLSCFNLVVAVQRRRGLRALLLVVGINAVLLAVFGTLQKLMGSTALYFGAVKTAQPYFFASFFYHNHWGAFTLLMTSLSLGLFFQSLKQIRRGFMRSPGLLGLIGIALLAITIPLSTSRSSTLLAGCLLVGAFSWWLWSFVRERRSSGRGVALSLAACVAGILAVAAFAYDLARPIIKLRLADTQEQLAAMRARGESLPRQILYRDTWNMAREKLWFGWGMGAYPTSFYHHNTQHESSDGPVRLFHDAHSDWLQSVSDVGLIGTILLALCGLLPLLLSRGGFRGSPLTTFLFIGCSLILVYALLEFPFGNRAVVLAFWMCFFCALRYGQLDARNSQRA